MTGQNEYYKEMKKLFNSFEGVDLHERKGKRFNWQMHMTKEMQEAPIDVLELSVRSHGALKRAGYSTVGELVAAISGGTDIRRIRSCGQKSYAEIMEKLFLFNLANMSAQKRERYLQDVIEKNYK